MLTLEGKDVGALYQQAEDQKAQGIPPHWMAYVAVESADDATGRATELGGKVIVPPFDVFDVGRMAVLQDPTGATFAIWQPRSHKGAGIVNAPGAICWHELHTKDTDAAESFYSGLFGWTAQRSQSPCEQYTEWINGGKHIGGMIKPHWDAPPNWMTHFHG